MTTTTEATVRPLLRLPASSGPKLAAHGSPSTELQGTGRPTPTPTFVRGGVGRHPVRRGEPWQPPAASEPAFSAPAPLRYPPRSYADVDVLQKAADASLSPQVFGLVRDGHLSAAKVLMQAYGMSADATHAGLTLDQVLARTRAPLHDLAMFERFLVDVRSKAKRAQVEVPARPVEAPIGQRVVVEPPRVIDVPATAPIELAASPETEVRRRVPSDPLPVDSPNVREVGAGRFGRSVRPALHVVKRGCVDPVLRVLDNGKEAALSLYSYLFFSSGPGVPVFTKRRVRR